MYYEDYEDDKHKKYKSYNDQKKMANIVIIMIAIIFCFIILLNIIPDISNTIGENIYTSPEYCINNENNTLLIKEIKNFLNIDECEKIIMEGLDRGLTKSKVKSTQDPKIRDSYSSVIYKYEMNGNKDINILINKIYNSLSKWSEKSIEYIEDLNIVYYKKGQEFLYHIDTFDENSIEMKLSNNSQRIMSAVIFLNTVDKGGELHFPNNNIIIKPEIGNVILWNNIYYSNINTTKKYYVSHGSLPIINGEKWIIVTWIRDKIINIF
jgi:prolyl 4-hydroxylase